MNFSKICLKLVFVFTIALFSMNLFTVVVFANSDDINKETNNASSNHELVPTVVEKKVLLNESVEVSFDDFRR